MRAARARLLAPVDAAFLVTVRALYGVIVCASTLRVLWLGAQAGSPYRDWVEAFFIRQPFHFKYYGFAWVKAPPGSGMYVLLGAIVALSIASAVGLFYRQSAAALAVCFTWFQLIDATFFVNHYYLLSLLGGLLAISPAGRHGSIDAWWQRKRSGIDRPAQVAGAWLFLLRFQVGVVYTFAGLAKMHSDWLLHAQPLRIWLAGRADLPWLGPLVRQSWMAPTMSWAGFLFDVTIPWLLLWPRVRPAAYAAVIGFHALTYLLFPRITMFPVIMIAFALVFFPPDWPRRMFERMRRVSGHPPAATARAGLAAPTGVALPARSWLCDAGLVALALYCAVQLLLPLRSLAYGGDVRWHEQGLRFSWRVLHREKLGSVTFQVLEPRSGQRWEVDPLLYLNPTQASEMAEQPDLILQLAHHIRDDFARRGLGVVQVRARALATLNGRRGALLVDPSVDLGTVEDSLRPAPWILPVPAEPPVHNKVAR